MKTTVIIKDELVDLLVKHAFETYKSKKKISEALNSILADFFFKKKELFGSTKPFDLSDLRDKSDRFN